MPAGREDDRRARKNDVFHETHSKLFFALQRGSGTAGRQRNHLPGPKRRNHPLHHIALGMAVAHDIALTVDLKSVRLDDLAWDGHICVGQADAVKLNLQVSLSEKVTGLLGCFKMTLQVAASGEDGPSKLLKATEMTQDRIADRRGR